jgi:hypothetical protein
VEMLKGLHDGTVFIVSENDLSAVCAPCEQLSVARTVKLNDPSDVGFPDMSPVGLSNKPGGSDPERRLRVTGDSPPEV